MKPIQLLLDGDDTCWYCRHNYFHASWVCGLIICEALEHLAPAPHEVLDLQRQIEQEAMKGQGYRFTQYEDAWVETYRRLTERYAVRQFPALERQIHHEAAYIKRADYPGIPNLHRTLGQLRERVSQMHLISLGDRAFQLSKVERNGIGHFFDSIRITQGDKGLVMQELEDPTMLSIMGGDNLTSDIEPALKHGVLPVWIHNTSPWAQSENGIDHRVNVVQQLEEFVPFIDGLPDSAHR